MFRAKKTAPATPCVNGSLLPPSNREGWWSPQPSKPKDASQFMNQECPKFGFEKCPNPACRDVYDKLACVAPDSTAVAQDCPGLRSWALNFTSCWVANPSAADKKGAIHDAMDFCAFFLKVCRGFGDMQIPTLNTTVLGICDLFYWVNYLFPTTETDEWEVARGMGQQAVMSTVLRDDALNVTKGICRLRLWNTAQHTPRGLVELVSLKSLLQKPETKISPRHLGRHANCSVEVCWQNDENTTDVPQLHIHLGMGQNPGAICPEVRFPVDKLNTIATPVGGATAWSLSSNPPKLGCRQYMAISHVWSDGTGAGGSKERGVINRCLVDRWERMARELNCDGIWWDTVSLPTDREKRINALSEMHLNYKQARCTVVHDLELTSFTWTEDGSPSVAIALSTWFSRGWTALELFMSENVWVVFKNPQGVPQDPNNYVLKNLDSDVLACPNDPFAHPAHKAVSAVIRKYRPMHNDCKSRTCTGACSDSTIFSTNYLELDDLMSLLKPRYTCWPRDMAIITGLMTYVARGIKTKFNASWNQIDMTKHVISAFEQVSATNLLHDKLPICETGPWSWCPPSIFDLADHKDEYLAVVDGTLCGWWDAYPFPHKLKNGTGLRPHGKHDMIKHRVLAASETPYEHLLLAPRNRKRVHDEAPFMLVKMLPNPNLVPHQHPDFDYHKHGMLMRFIAVVLLAEKAVDMASGARDNASLEFRGFLNMPFIIT